MPFEVEVTASKTPFQDGILEVPSRLLEDYFGVTRKTLTKWAEKGCPKLDRNLWDFIAVLKWRGVFGGDESDDDLPAANLRKVKAEAYLKERQGQLADIELQQIRGEVVRISDVEHILGGVIMNTKGLLSALPSKAAPRLVGLSAMEELQTILSGHIHAFIKARKAVDVEGIIETALEDFREAETITEINEILAILIHEALEELSTMELSRFGAGDEHEKGGGVVHIPDGDVETPGED